MITEDIAVIGWILAMVFGMTTAFLSGWGIMLHRKNTRLNEENTRLNRINTELNKVKLAPHVNIGGAFVHTPYGEKEDKARVINVNVDNSGGGEANFPKSFWILRLKNHNEYSSQEWLDFKILEEDELIPARSYIPANSSFYENTYHFKLVTSKEGDLFDTLRIWLKYKDARNLDWRSDAEFQYTEDGGWITKRESRTYRVSKAKENNKRLWRK